MGAVRRSPGCRMIPNGTDRLRCRAGRGKCRRDEVFTSVLESPTHLSLSGCEHSDTVPTSGAVRPPPDPLAQIFLPSGMHRPIGSVHSFLSAAAAPQGRPPCFRVSQVLRRAALVSRGSRRAAIRFRSHRLAVCPYTPRFTWSVRVPADLGDRPWHRFSCSSRCRPRHSRIAFVMRVIR
jgi:hypothetical protein